MTLRELIGDVEARCGQITVRAPPASSDLARTLTEHFETENVVVEYEPVEADEDAEVLLVDDGVLVARLCAGAASALAAPAIDAPWRPAFEACDYRDLLVHLDDTLFTGYDRRQMLATSREIEDRAWRAGSGQVYAGFQTFSAFRSQEPVYRHLARTDLSIDVYGAADCEPPSIDGITVHHSTEQAVADVWFLVFDDEDDRDACALLAEERRPGEYFGFWTYDSATVDEAVAAIERLE
jgi:hypothetical protein